MDRIKLLYSVVHGVWMKSNFLFKFLIKNIYDSMGLYRNTAISTKSTAVNTDGESTQMCTYVIRISSLKNKTREEFSGSMRIFLCQCHICNCYSSQY